MSGSEEIRVCQMCGAQMPGVSANRKYCGPCAAQRRKEENKASRARARDREYAKPHPCAVCGAPVYGSKKIKLCKNCKSRNVLEQINRQNEKRKAENSKNLHVCSVCGAPVDSGRKKYCDACREKVARERNKARDAEKRKEERERRRIQGHPCMICGTMMYNDPKTRYCEDCKQIAKKSGLPHKKEDAVKKIRELGLGRAERASDAAHQCGRRSYSMQYTFDELVRLASQHGTSYGKFCAWINGHNRLPEAGELML